MVRVVLAISVIVSVAVVFMSARHDVAKVPAAPAPTQAVRGDSASPVTTTPDPVVTSPGTPTPSSSRAESLPTPKSDRKGDWMGETWVEHGTPPECLKSYIEGYRPVKILADGTQVFENMPGKVRNSQGVLEERKVTISVNPTKPVPVDATEAGR